MRIVIIPQTKYFDPFDLLILSQIAIIIPITKKTPVYISYFIYHTSLNIFTIYSFNWADCRGHLLLKINQISTTSITFIIQYTYGFLLYSSKKCKVITSCLLQVDSFSFSGEKYVNVGTFPRP